MENKILIIDQSIYFHRAGYATKFNPKIPATYTCMRMLVSTLKMIGLNKEDTVIIAMDGRGNWRKELKGGEEYKGQRNAQREASGIDWDKLWKDFDWLTKKLFEATNWHIIRENLYEADDIAAVVVKHIEDKPIVCVSYDGDWEQLWYRPNVKIFSQHPKTKGYKIKLVDFDPYLLLAKKINQEKKENLVSVVSGTEEYENRNLMKNMIDVPQFVDDTLWPLIKTSLDNPRTLDLTKMPFPSLLPEYEKMYNSDKIVTEADSIKQKEKKKIKFLKKRGIKPRIISDQNKLKL
jgi:hypothetical protein